MHIRFIPATLVCTVFAVLVITILDYLFLSSALALPEDGFIESLSALAFLVSTVGAAAASWTAGHRGARIVAACIGTLALTAFLSEISFGRSTVAFYKEPVIYGKPIDAVHDLFFVAYEIFVTQFSRDGLWPIALVVAATSIVSLWLMRGTIKYLDAHSAAFRYLVCACVFILAALIIDLDFATGDLVYAIEEMLELDGALVLTAGATAQIIQNRVARKQQRRID